MPYDGLAGRPRSIGPTAAVGRLVAPELLYLFFGERDSFIPLDEVRRIETRLRELGKDVRCKVYRGADHGFFNEERPSVYHPEAAEDAWEELERFLATHLKGAV